MQAAIFIKPDLSLIYFNYGLNKLTHQSLTLEIEYGSVILIIRKVLVLVQVQLEEHNNQLQWPSWVFSFWTKESGFKSIVGTQGMSRTRLQTVSKLDFLVFMNNLCSIFIGSVTHLWKKHAQSQWCWWMHPEATAFFWT